MSHQKDKHYWTQLRSALAAGQWSAQYPAKAPNGIALSWSELFRKFNKHCRGFNDVSEVASQTQALALLLAANSKDEDQDNAVEGTQYPLDLGHECMLPEERLDEASAGYEVLKRLESSNFDVSCLDYIRTLNHKHPCRHSTLLWHIMHMPLETHRNVLSISAKFPISCTSRTIYRRRVRRGRAQWGCSCQDPRRRRLSRQRAEVSRH